MASNLEIVTSKVKIKIFSAGILITEETAFSDLTSEKFKKLKEEIEKRVRNGEFSITFGSSQKYIVTEVCVDVYINDTWNNEYSFAIKT